MSQVPIFATAGSEAVKIDVRLSYRIVRLFSEGLYASPNKAIEELVANSFDAGARRVAVLLPADFHDQGATIAVLDDGEGTYIRNSSIVAALAEERGLSLVSRHSRALPANRRYLPPPRRDGSTAAMDSRMRREAVLVFCKSAF